MILSGLKPLYRSMKALPARRYTFDYRVRRESRIVVFSVNLLTGDSPFTLLFGCRALNIFFRFDVQRGFRIDLRDLPPPAMENIRRGLGLKWHPDNPYTPTAFMQEFNDSDQIPQVAVAQEPRPDRISAAPTDIEEGDRIFFISWRNNHENCRVTRENLAKTRLLIGEDYAGICEQNNISSCWSARPTDRKPVTQPAARVPAGP